VNKVAINQQSN